MLYTNLNHIETASQHAQIISENQNAIVIGGRMDHQSIKVFQIAEVLKEKFYDVKFYDMELDNPEMNKINFQSLTTLEQETPIIFIYKKGKMVSSMKGIQSKEELNEILNTQFLQQSI